MSVVFVEVMVLIGYMGFVIVLSQGLMMMDFVRHSQMKSYKSI